MFVWAGTITPDPATNNYPDDQDIGPNPEAYVGQQVKLEGTVVATDPVVVSADYGDDTHKITFEDVDEPITTGQQISASTS